MMLYENTHAYNSDYNIWMILLSRGVRSPLPFFYMENNILSLTYLNVISNYDETYFYKCVYDAINNVENFYKYKFISCTKIDDSRGFEIKFKLN